MTGWVMKEHGVLDSHITVIEEDLEYQKQHQLKTRAAYWKCQCDCGNICSI